MTSLKKTTKEILQEVVEIINECNRRIAEAEASDGEVDSFDGNSYSWAEAGGFFRSFAERVVEHLPEGIEIVFPVVEADDDDEY